MSESRDGNRRGIEISAEVAESARVSEGLDVDYRVPDTARRRRAGYVYLGGALIGALAALTGVGKEFWALTATAVAIATYHFVSGRTLQVTEREALDTANRHTGFAVGHASAAVGFDGPLARPVWNVLLFSADDPPTERALVRIDASTGELVGTYQEHIDTTT